MQCDGYSRCLKVFSQSIFTALISSTSPECILVRWQCSALADETAPCNSASCRSMSALSRAMSTISDSDIAGSVLLVEPASSAACVGVVSHAFSHDRRFCTANTPRAPSSSRIPHSCGQCKHIEWTLGTRITRHRHMLAKD